MPSFMYNIGVFASVGDSSIRESIGNQCVSGQALLICAKIVLSIAPDIVLNSKTQKHQNTCGDGLKCKKS